MQADSSAKRTCRESRSTSLWTATVRIPISLQVQIIRQAISPRLAIRILRNLRLTELMMGPKSKVQSPKSDVFVPKRVLDIGPWTLDRLLLYPEQWLAVFNRLAVLDVNLR